MEQSILPDYYAAQIANYVNETEYIRQMYIVFNGLKGELKKDGNKWCATCGEWPEHNISGFADSPSLAMQNWFNEYHKN